MYLAVMRRAGENSCPFPFLSCNDMSVVPTTVKIKMNYLLFIIFLLDVIFIYRLDKVADYRIQYDDKTKSYNLHNATEFN